MHDYIVHDTNVNNKMETHAEVLFKYYALTGAQ
jgi:hypothetical protein